MSFSLLSLVHTHRLHRMLPDLVILMMLVTASLGESDSCPDSGETEKLRRTGPTDHWPTVTNAGACKLEHCSREMVR